MQGGLAGFSIFAARAAGIQSMRTLEKAFVLLTVPVIALLAVMGVVMGSMPYVVKILDAMF